MNFLFNKLVTFIFLILYRFSYGRLFIDIISARIRNNVLSLKHGEIQFKFASPNALCHYRIKTFASKEPETLEWINNFEQDCILWDIGANIGLYSIYAAKTRNASVFAFEPSVFNLEFLASNINYNQVDKNVTIIPIPLTDKTQFSMMRMTSTEWSGALSTFEKNIGWDGKAIETVFNYQIVGVTMNSLISSFGLSIPDYMKIDVDGIEHFILMGGEDILKNVKEVLIEVNDNFHEQADLCSVILTRNGLRMIEKRHSQEFDEIGALGNGKVWNQIWKRMY